MKRNRCEQIIGSITGSKNIEISQISKTNHTQRVGNISDSQRVNIKQLPELESKIIFLAEDVLELALENKSKIGEIVAEGLPPDVKDIESVTQHQLEKSLEIVQSYSGAGPSKVAEAISSLANASSLLGGGIAISSIQDPVVQAVSVPLVLTLAGLSNSKITSKYFAKIKKIITG